MRNLTMMTDYAVAAGLEQAIDYVRNLHFSNEDITYLRSLNIFDEAFLARLATLRFTGEILAVPEGTIIFPGEPIVRVIAPIMEAQLLDRHQSLSRRAGGPRRQRAGIWPSPRAGTGRRYLRRACSRNRRLSGDKQRAHRPALRRSCRRHACTQLGHGFPGLAERFPRLC